MANKTVYLSSQIYANANNLTLFLIDPVSGAIANGSGDTLTPGSNGVFSAVVTEAISGWFMIVVKQAGTSVLENKWVYFPADVVGNYIVDFPGVAAYSNAGIGARAVTVTVNDGTNIIEGATVRFSRAGESYSIVTNALGKAVFSLNDGTWTLSITAPGFVYSPTTQIVDGTENWTVSMSSNNTITPSLAPQTTGYWTVFNEDGDVDAGAIIELRTAAPPSGAGLILEDRVREGVAGNDGVVQFTKLFKGASYIINRQDSSRKYTVTIPESAGNTIALGNILG